MLSLGPYREAPATAISIFPRCSLTRCHLAWNLEIMALWGNRAGLSVSLVT